MELAFLALVVVAAVFLGIVSARWILRHVKSTILGLLLVCATVALLLFGLWAVWIVLYFATGGH